ncbi:MAG: CTP synthase [Candidatus Woesearchaeota archaeon]
MARITSNGKTSHTKWIIVTGGVVSGLGKGVVSSSVGALLKTQGFTVTATKIDPYINIDAGTMRPTVHGEVYVTYDGGETDQDLGNYERFLDEKISRWNNITTGQIYKRVIEKERNLEYGGSDVEVTKHVPLEIKRRLYENAEKAKADYMIVEIGGTVGDYQNLVFLEAVRQMKLEGEKMMFVHVSYLPLLENVGELKTKPTQHSVRALNSSGIFADLIIARSTIPIDEPRREKISYFCNIPKENVISSPDLSSIYRVPATYADQGLGEALAGHFGFAWKHTATLKEWQEFDKKLQRLDKTVKVGVVGKYFDIGDCTLEDSYISVLEAVKAACYAEGAEPDIVWMDSKEFEEDLSKVEERLSRVDAVIVPGGFGKSGVEGKIEAIRYCREHQKPFLGLCYGMQLAVIEWARHVTGLKEANSKEIDEGTPHPVIDILPEQVELLKKKQYGNTMRLGDYPADLKERSLVARLYGTDKAVERHRHRYEVNPDYVDKLQGRGLVFSGKSPDGKLMEYAELEKHPFFVGTQAHPEFTSRPMKPQPLFAGLIKAGLEQQRL